MTPYAPVDPTAHTIDAVDEFGNMYPHDLLPWDAWVCAECATHVGYTTYDTADSTGLAWREAYADGDPTAPGTRFLCADCATTQPQPERTPQ